MNFVQIKSIYIGKMLNPVSPNFVRVTNKSNICCKPSNFWLDITGGQAFSPIYVVTRRRSVHDPFNPLTPLTKPSLVAQYASLAAPCFAICRLVQLHCDEEGQLLRREHPTVVGSNHRGFKRTRSQRPVGSVGGRPGRYRS